MMAARIAPPISAQRRHGDVAAEHGPRDRGAAASVPFPPPASRGSAALVDGRDVPLERAALAARVLLGLAALDFLQELVEPA